MDNQLFEEPSQPREVRKGPSLAYGLLTGLAMVVCSLVLYFANVPAGSWLNYIVLVFLLAGVIMFCFSYSKENDYFVTFGSVFKAAFRMVAAATLVVVAWALLSSWLFPDMKEKALQDMMEQIVKSNTPREQIDQEMKMRSKYYTVFMTMVVLFSNLFYGFVFSLIGAAVTKKRKPQQSF